MSLAGRVAIVTGGARRLGAAIVSALAERGAAVCIHFGRCADDAQALLDRLRAQGRRATTVSADLLRPDAAAKTIVGRCVETLGPPDLLIHAASIFEPGTLDTTTDDDWNRNLAVHLTAPAALCREFVAARAKGMRQQIVSILDGHVTRPTPGRLAYLVSKSALATLTRVLALELAPDVQVNAVAPGAVLPPDAAPDDHRRRAETSIPLGRTGTPDDVVRAVLFLAESEFITGEIVSVTGGEFL